MFIKRLLDMAIGKSRLLKPEVMISVPAGITSVEERAVIDAVASAGASKVYLIPEPIAAAIGAEIPIHTSAGNMIVNMGGGTSEVAIISLNGIVLSKSQRTGGDALNEIIINYIRKNFGLLIGEQMSESIKMKIASAVNLENPEQMEVRGRDLNSGLPGTLTVNTNQLVQPINSILKDIIYSIKDVLEKTPPELSSDIIDHGIVLSGGTALLKGIDDLFTRALGVPVYVVEDPLTAVIRGIAKALDHIDELKRTLKEG